MLHSDLHTYLTGTSAIAELFPGGIFHESVPQDVNRWPAMSFFQVAQVEYADDMEAPNDAKMDHHSYQFDVIADTSRSCIEAGNAFLAILRNFRGTMTATKVNWVSLSNVSQLEERRGDKLRRRVSMDFSFFVDV